jgi:hypothetical protein
VNYVRTQLLSNGGGANSVAMMVLSVEGKLARPDHIVIADTGREATSTWDYLEEVLRPYLQRAGLSVVVASHSLATVDLYGGNGDLLIPVFTDGGAMPAFCSNEWKQRVVGRWARSIGIDECDVWIGFTTDEIGRVKPGPDKWMRRVFPLIDAMITRRDCYSIIERAGLPLPPKSACWMCRHRSNAEWRFLRDEYPQDFQRAIQLEVEVNQTHPGVYLHVDRVALSEANIDAPDLRDERDMQCGLGMCMV